MMTSSDLKNQWHELRTEFERLYGVERYQPTFSPGLREVVRKIEALQRQIDMETGFSKAQLACHDLVFSLETIEERHGKVASTTLENLLTRLLAILDTIAPGANTEFEYQVVGVAAGSGSILADIEPRQPRIDEPDDLERKNALRSRFRSVVEYAGKIGEIGDPTEKLDQFMHDLGLDKEKAYQITRQVAGMYPRPGDSSPSISVVAGSGETPSVAVLPVAKRLNAERVKKVALDRIKPVEELEIKGRLGVVEAWEDNRKIAIMDDAARVHTVNYEPNDYTMRKIKANIGEMVTIVRMRDPEDKRRWILESWKEAK